MKSHAHIRQIEDADTFITIQDGYQILSNQAIDILAKAGDLDLRASGTLTLDANGASIVVDASNAIDIDAGAALAMDSVGAMTIIAGGSQTFTSGGATYINSDNSIINTTGVGSSFSVSAGQGVSIDTTAGDLDLLAGGNVVLNPTGEIRLDSTVDTSGSALTIQANGGASAMNLNASSFVLTGASAVVTIQDGAITTSAGDDLDLNAGSGADNITMTAVDIDMTASTVVRTPHIVADPGALDGYMAYGYPSTGETFHIYVTPNLSEGDGDNQNQCRYFDNVTHDAHWIIPLPTNCVIESMIIHYTSAGGTGSSVIDAELEERAATVAETLHGSDVASASSSVNGASSLEVITSHVIVSSTNTYMLHIGQGADATNLRVGTIDVTVRCFGVPIMTRF